MTGRSLLSEASDRADRAEQALERVLALADVMGRSSSAPVREAAASIRTLIVKKEQA